MRHEKRRYVCSENGIEPQIFGPIGKRREKKAPRLKEINTKERE